MTVWRVHVSIALSALLVAASYRAKAAQDQPSPRPFQTEVNYVRVDMYPTANGKPVTDLLQSEIEVLEDGAPQTISQFEHVFISGPRSQTPRREPSTTDEMRRAAQDPRARVFVLFLDPRHVDLQGSLRVRRPLIDTLNALMSGDDLIAVMTPEMSARDLTFTRRLGSIEEMLTPHWGKERWVSTRDPVEVRYEACYSKPGRIVDGPQIAREMIARRREMLTLDALEGLVHHLRGLREERKAVITISDGWPLYEPDRELAKPLIDPTTGEPVKVDVPKIGRDPRTGRITPRVPSPITMISNDGVSEFDLSTCENDRVNLATLNHRHRFVTMMQTANRANVSFYPVAPGGVSEGYTPLKAEADPLSLSDLWNLAAIQNQWRKTSNARRRSLEMMADITDGRAVLEADFMETGFRRMVEDLSSYYLLGYYSSGKSDGKFHQITVRIKRPGVQVRARAGYLAANAADAAGGVAKPTTVDTSESRLVTEALASLAAFTRDLPLRVSAAAAWTASGKAVIRAVAEVTRSTASGDDWSSGGDAEVTILNGAGRKVATQREPIAAGMFVAAMTIELPSPLAADDYRLQFRTKGTRALGSSEAISLRLDAAPIGTGVMFLRRMVAREVPTADSRFRRTERIIIETPAAFAKDISARLLDRTGKPLAVPVTAVIREGTDGTRWHRLELTLAPLAPADYVVESTSGTDRTLIAFRVVP